MEQANESLRYEISKRDKSIDDLKVQMQQIQEQHSRQIRNLQGIHNQELEAKGMVDSLLYKREAIRCSGKIYSEEYRRRFETKNATFKIEQSPVDGHKFSTRRACPCLQ